MQFTEIFRRAGRPLLSYEFFPPRNPAARTGFDPMFDALAALKPDFVSVTCGAGGSSQTATLPVVIGLQQRQSIPVVPHLTCIGRSSADIDRTLEQYAAAGVQNLLALRGDLPAGADAPEGSFRHAADLVSWIRRSRQNSAASSGSGNFGIGVAGFPEGHPAAPNRWLEMDYLKAKVDAGADFICTQVFYENRDFHDFRERCAIAGIRVPVLAGLLPLRSPAQMKRMAELAGRMRYPATLLRALERAGGCEETFRRIAVHHTIAQCHDLLNHGTDGLHFYTLNQQDAVLSVLESAGLPPRQP